MKAETIINLVLKLVVIAVLIFIGVRVYTYLDAMETDLRTNTIYTEQVIKSYK